MEGDELLLGRLRAGEEAAFEELVASHDASLRRVARSFVRTPAAADEVTQDTWLAVVKGLSSFEGRSSLRTWIFGILVNRARTRALRDARTIPFAALSDDDRPAVDPNAFDNHGRWRSSPNRLDGDPERMLLSSELGGHLMQVVDSLHPQQRAVLVLRDVVGLPASDVCMLLDISEGNQRVMLHRARSHARTALVDLMGERAR